MKIHFRSAVVFIVVIAAGNAGAQDPGQAAGQSQAKPPVQAAKPPAKAAEPEEAIPAPAPNAMFPAVVARVNGKAILGRDLEQRVRAELNSIGDPAWKDLRDDYRTQLTGTSLGQLIGDELLYQKAASSSTAPTQADIQAEFEKFVKSYPNDAALNIELANRGMDRKALMQDLARTLTVERYIQENITKKLTVTPAEVADYYAKNPDQFKHPDLIRSSHILISLPEKATAEQEKLVRQRAEALRDRARKGEDFAKLAKENSMDPSASRGGDIGLTENGELEPAYEDAAAKLKIGEISDIIRTSYGFHIIKLTDRKKAGTATLDDVRDQLNDFLKAQKEDAEVAKLVKTLQGLAKIEVLLPGIK